MQISARHSDNTTIFDVTGDIDLANSPEVRKALLREVREKRTPRVVMNLSKVRYIDSSGVASLVEGRLQEAIEHEHGADRSVPAFAGAMTPGFRRAG